MEDKNSHNQTKRFTTVLTEEVMNFVQKQENKAREKILFNIRKAETNLDPEIFKKLTEDIWEFRTLWKRTHYRLLAFWDKYEEVMVIVTHGFIKKTDKTPIKEIERARIIRYKYLTDKISKKNEII